MSRSNRRNNQMATGYTPTTQQQSQGGSGGQGVSGLPWGTLNINLGKKGLTISGPSIQPVTVPLQRQQQRQQQQVNPQFSGGGGQGNIGGVISACLIAAQTQGEIAAQQFALHQQAQSANQQLLTSLTLIATQMGMPMANPTQKQRKSYRTPQQQHNQQQSQSRQKKQKQQQPQFAYAGS